MFAGCGHKSPVGPALPAWKPNPALVGDLAPEVTLQGYSIRPPQGYESRQADALRILQPFGVDMYLWHNAQENPDASGLSVQIIKRRNLDTATDVLDYELNLSKQDMEKFAHSKPETGKVNGIIFARAYWQGDEKHPSGTYTRRGFSYASTSSGQGIYISGYDRVPCNSEPCKYQPIDQMTLPVAEAAALTFRKL